MVRNFFLALGAVFILVLIGLGYMLVQHRIGVSEADAAWAAHKPEPLGDIGTTDTLEILPLVDWHTDRDDLLTDAGVSYLVKTDDITILFDTGNNTGNADPPPLERNMKTLGIGLDGIDTIVISHAHFDHIGGRKWSGGKVSGSTFGIGNRQPDLKGKRVVTAIEMTYPGISPEVGTDPLRLAEGVATTGTIPRKLLPGRIDEQALAVNVRGKGIVLIVGCGHQTLSRLIERTERVFDAPIYGVIGGLHYPVPEGRLRMFGLDVQRIGASGSGPLDPLTQEDIDAEFALLESRKIRLLAIGGHDSSDEVIAQAKARFGDAYRYIKVGERLKVE